MKRLLLALVCALTISQRTIPLPSKTTMAGIACLAGATIVGTNNTQTVKDYIQSLPGNMKNWALSRSEKDLGLGLTTTGAGLIGLSLLRTLVEEEWHIGKACDGSERWYPGKAPAHNLQCRRFGGHIQFGTTIFPNQATTRILRNFGYACLAGAGLLAAKNAKAISEKVISTAKTFGNKTLSLPGEIKKTTISTTKSIKDWASNPQVMIGLGLAVAGVVILTTKK